MSSSEAVRVAGVIARTDVGLVDAVGVGVLFERIRHVEAWLQERKTAGVRRLEELRAQGAAGRVEVAVGQVFGAGEARRVSRRREVSDAAPALEAVLGDGLVTAGHVDAVAAAAAQTPAVLDHQDELAAAAVVMGPDEFGRLCKRMAMLVDPDGGVATLDKQRKASTVARWVDAYTGMYHLRAELDPQRGARVWAALDKQIETRFHTGADTDSGNDQRAAGALVDLCTTGAGAAGGGRGTVGGGGAVVHVHIDLDTLRDGLRADSTVEVTGGGVLPVDTIRRMVCDDAELIPYWLGVSDGLCRWRAVT